MPSENDKNTIVEKKIEAQPLHYLQLNTELKRDSSIILLALAHIDPDYTRILWEAIPEDKKQQEKILIAAVSKDPSLLIGADYKHRNNYKIMLAAVKTDAKAYTMVGPKLSKDVTLIKETLSNIKTVTEYEVIERMLPKESKEDIAIKKQLETIKSNFTVKLEKLSALKSNSMFQIERFHDDTSADKENESSPSSTSSKPTHK